MKLLRLFGAILLVSLFVSTAHSEEMDEPLVWTQESTNTIMQKANPGPGAHSSQYHNNENIFFYSTDGDGLLGPGQRPDISISSLSFMNLHMKHQHIMFDQPPYSATRPEARVGFYPLGAGWFDIAMLTYGGTLRMTTGAAAGGGGTFTLDHMPFQMLPGQQMAWFIYPYYVGNQYIELGWSTNANNKVFFQRSEPTGAEASWTVQSIQAGTVHSTSTGVMTGTDRRIFILYYRASVGIEFYIGNSNNTAVKVHTVPISQLPNGGSIAYAYLKFYNQGAGATTKYLYMTNWYARLLPRRLSKVTRRATVRRASVRQTARMAPRRVRPALCA